MALTFTPSVELGVECPDFSLPGIDGKTYSRRDFSNGKPFAVMFICNHCPYVKAIEDRLIQLGKDLRALDVHLVAICSNDASEHPDDSFENLRKRSQEKNYSFVYLHDESQTAAHQFGAVCTPDFFVYDSHLRSAYRGRLDDSWKDPRQVKNRELFHAIENLLTNKPLTMPQTPSMGCNIKWKTKA